MNAANVYYGDHGALTGKRGLTPEEAAALLRGGCPPPDPNADLRGHLSAIMSACDELDRRGVTKWLVFTPPAPGSTVQYAGWVYDEAQVRALTDQQSLALLTGSEAARR